MNLPLDNSPFFANPQSHEPMLHNVTVTSCGANGAHAQNKGLMNDFRALVTSMFPHLCQLTPIQTRALALRLKGIPAARIAQALAGQAHVAQDILHTHAGERVLPDELHRLAQVGFTPEPAPAPGAADR